MSTSIPKALPGKLDIKRHSPSILYVCVQSFSLDVVGWFVICDWKLPAHSDLFCIQIFELVHEISNNVVCATSKAFDQPAHMRSLIRAFASRLSILWLLNYWLNIIWSFLA